ncbi:MAG TPA: AbrB/MazE/SpoVT family DNA-binding domain-containing protein [Candidatus Acidoferrales bacterium]|nr:AbrB/MazE/SpoVT family DNA-binding domain-containing protein [Candidatus Acidoferrales bacterium]
MRTAVKECGNSVSVRIPAGVPRAAKLKVDDAVTVREEAGRIVIEPVERKEYELAALVRGITARNQHDEIDFGAPVGKGRR